jgi:hypothetical protein
VVRKRIMYVRTNLKKLIVPSLISTMQVLTW